MVETLLTEICVALIVLSLLILINSKSVFTYRTLLVLFFAVFFIDNLLIVLTNRFSSLQIIPNTIWEGFLICGWSGKLYSIVVMIILLFLTRRCSARGGRLYFPQTPAYSSACIVLLLAAWALWESPSVPDLQPWPTQRSCPA
jgi:hypothetical protein